MATQGTSSSSFPASASTSRRDQPDEDSENDSEDESVELADPSDPDTELLSASESYSLLKSMIIGKYTDIKTDSKVVERSSF